jgi:cereblon
MTASGSVGAYINPHGYMHEIVTVRHAEGLRDVGGPETAATWFAGYTWTIVACARCGAHLGWRYDCAQGGSPVVFWGLLRVALGSSE